MYKLSLIDKISLLLIIIGAINWGLIGLFDFNVTKFVFSFIPSLQRIIYIVIGLSGINVLLFIKKIEM
ncbi:MULTISPECIES: DUF378 domain-containing protein [Clostridium]|uniref:DUF378 domain-containing protein n=2 Tax=Clostridium TaxID=1485 RepID=A0A151AQF5_9CLOT|nr:MULTISPECIES: DUF378 domain-containing protein [Clostridium]MBE6079020.1 DUF378 domain-containing protein [Clostridium lundense]KYH29866.1 hypothetical protein CLCOL_05040 [Clostridium colicanis DSM 13634]MBE6042679.1 DUF378 domain-containing protein [Clostridium thermopalmarium]PRR75247.1 hypothetical protein CPAL_07990 [Clostridium thermopalmarium DSM 5974]PVZ28003.1 hypothetical protein LX19_00542 [Clostridium thermopalmarium DSM 5974]